MRMSISQESILDRRKRASAAVPTKFAVILQWQESSLMLGSTYPYSHQMPECGTAVHITTVSTRLRSCPVAMQELADGMDMQDDPTAAAQDGTADGTTAPDAEVSNQATKS